MEFDVEKGPTCIEPIKMFPRLPEPNPADTMVSLA